MVVPGADGVEVLRELVGCANFVEPAQQLLLQREEQTLDPAVLPWAVRQGALMPLMPDPQNPEREAKQPRGEDPFVVGAQRLRLASRSGG